MDDVVKINKETLEKLENLECQDDNTFIILNVQFKNSSSVEMKIYKSNILDILNDPFVIKIY